VQAATQRMEVERFRVLWCFVTVCFKGDRKPKTQYEILHRQGNSF